MDNTEMIRGFNESALPRDDARMAAYFTGWMDAMKTARQPEVAPASSVPVPIPTAKELEQVWSEGRYAYFLNISDNTDILERIRATTAGFHAIHALLTKGRGGEGV